VPDISEGGRRDGLVSELDPAARHVVAQLVAHRGVDRRLLVLVERLLVDAAGALGGVEAAVLRPPVEVLGGGQKRP
jgi:hypothetical protein